MKSFDAKNFILDVCGSLWCATILHYKNFLLQSAFDKLDHVYKWETKYKHNLLYKKIAEVISKKFHLGY